MVGVLQDRAEVRPLGHPPEEMADTLDSVAGVRPRGTVAGSMSRTLVATLQVQVDAGFAVHVVTRPTAPVPSLDSIRREW